MPQIFIEDSGKPKHPKNGKSISNTTGSHLVSCRVISRPATVIEREKEVLIVYILMKRRQNLFLYYYYLFHFYVF